jgi:hypothetical protein
MKSLISRATIMILMALLTLVPNTVFSSSSFLGPLNANSLIVSTVPANGDINPYGVAVVQRSTGNLVKGDILISNFNDKSNSQGKGTTIVEASPNGTLRLFAQLDAVKLPGACPGGVGLTTALVVLREGWVIVGSLPTADGMAGTAKAGCLIVLNSKGKAVETISGHLINGPWDMTAFEKGNRATLFVTNVLNGTVAASPNVVNKGDVVRIVLSLDDNDLPQVLSRTVIASGFGERTDPAALVIGPTGLGLGSNGTLYVADTLANRIAAIPGALSRHSSAGKGKTVLSGQALNSPLGLTIAPNGDILVANGNDGNLVEVTRSGMQVDTKMVDRTGAGGGTLFGLSISLDGKGVYYVNDGDNTINLLH